MFQPFCTPLSGFAKVSYIYGIVMAGKADAVSLTTWMISIGTNLGKFQGYIHTNVVRLNNLFDW